MDSRMLLHQRPPVWQAEASSILAEMMTVPVTKKRGRRLSPQLLKDESETRATTATIEDGRDSSVQCQEMGSR